ncbi:MAG: DUF692 domain-containing protein [Gammaproteobacteria bacterium]|jgi:uncharacterized protein (UPF0276 family)
MTAGNQQREYPVHGAGLGLRRALMGPLADTFPDSVNFLEVAPENWLTLGGSLGRQFRAFTERHPFVCHGLSLSLGGPAPLDEDFLVRLRDFLERHNIRCYSEHLSYCGDNGHLYDLLPIPFTEEAVDYVARRIRRTEEILQRRIAVENVSYYAAPGRAMDEITFINAVLERADCDLLLDVNNIYVNSINHGYDAETFLRALPAERVAYFHVAGHYVEAEDLRVDTHGADVIDPVWDLLDKAYEHCGVVPTLLERDFNIPPLATLLDEIDTIQRIQARHLPAAATAATGHG